MTLNIHEELTLQSLIDGELSLAERNQCLAGVESDDAATWRKIALAFVEHQAFRTGLREGTTSQANAPRQSNASTSQQSKRAITPRRRQLQLAAAALSVVALVIAGFAWGHANGHEAGVQAARDLDTPSVARTDAPAITRPIALPANPAAEDPLLTDPWAAEIRAQWLQAGYVVDPRPVPVSVKLPGGGTADVILSDPDIQYVGNAVFQ